MANSPHGYLPLTSSPSVSPSSARKYYKPSQSGISLHQPPSSRKNARPFVVLCLVVAGFVLVSLAAVHHSQPASWAAAWSGTGAELDKQLAAVAETPESVYHATTEAPESTSDVLPSLQQHTSSSSESASAHTTSASTLAAAAPVAQEQDEDHDDVADGPEPLPECERTLMYTFGGRHGFGSEVSTLVRVATFAKVYDYKIFLDSHKWNYGSWEDYFLPPTHDCILPASTIKRKQILNPNFEPGQRKDPTWTKANHVSWRRDMNKLDVNLLNRFVDDQGALEAMHAADLRLVKAGGKAGGKTTKSNTEPLTPDESFPEVFHPAFRIEAEVLDELWKPNEEVQRVVDGLRTTLGLYSSSGKKKKNSAPTIGIHVRLGDKYLELSKGPKGARPNPGLAPSQLERFYRAAAAAIDTLRSSSTSSGSSPSRAKPTLILMSDDPDISAKFEQSTRSKAFRLVGTAHGLANQAVKGAEKHFVRLFRRQVEDGLGEQQHDEPAPLSEEEQLTPDPFRKTGGFREGAFNRLPEAQRIAITRKFVADLTVLSRDTDAVVMTASSNVGRLMALLAGQEKALDNGAVTSADIRWFPTAHFA